MRRFLLAFALASALASAAPVPVTRDAVKQMEQSLDRTVRRLDVNDPYDLIGFTRGVYLPGFGVVFTTELNLVQTIITPFDPQLTVTDLEKLHRKKLARLPLLKQSMRQMMVEAAQSLEAVPAGEHVVLGVTLFFRNFEIKDGLPRQVVMQAPRQALLDYKAKRITAAALDAQLRVQEY